ncbi:MAG: glycosyltransferase [Verrucomicrobia bacterium]|nr:glycosyltransferase [Verrucomicrobiota bacterium]
MIVKNETQVIRRCLESVRPFIDYWVIVDTGSTDGTQKLIKECMAKIPGELHERPWFDFEWNRNEALDLARRKGEYCLFIDADDELIPSPGFKLPRLDQDSYLINRQLENDAGFIDSTWTLLVRNALPWRWRGVLHEEILCCDAQTTGFLEGIVNRFHQDGARSQDPMKIAKDIEILKRGIPNSRNLFYLAEAYKAAGDFASSIQSYEKVVQLRENLEEVYWSLYWIGCMQKQLDVEPEIYLESFYKCYLERPSRAEPLCQLANHYILKKNYLMGFLLSQHGLALGGPDAPCCQRWIYDWALLLQFYSCADYLGKKAEANETRAKLLSNPRLPQNLRKELEAK